MSRELGWSHVWLILSTNRQASIAEAYRLGEIPFDLVLPDRDFNMAPTTFQPVIRSDKEAGLRELVLMRWGLVPFFTEGLSDVKGIFTINAKAETVETSPTCRAPHDTESLPRLSSA